MTASIGADPELFLRDERTGGVVPVVGLIGGTKEKPIPMTGMSEGFAIQEDNVMLEFNVPPAFDTTTFSAQIRDALDYVRNVIRITEQNLELDFGQCSRVFTHEQLDSKQARLFGCSTDFNAHEQGRALPAPNPDDLIVDDGAWRFSGGHVHLGYNSAVPDFVVAAMCDLYLGLPSISLDKQGVRRTLYGSAGRFRPTSYGIEYRTLSNFWIWDERLRTDIALRTFNLIHRLEGDTGELQRLFAEIPWPDVIRAINEEDETRSADLITYCARDLKMGDL